jgi:heme/copper-type cytochrome/quinol oxidase subunit 2
MQQLLSLFTVFAATPWGDCVSQDVATVKCLEPLFQNVVQAIVALVGVALFIMFLVAGFSFIFSGGDPKKLEQSKGTLTNAIIGLVIIVAAYIILNLIKVFTGVDVTTFKITFF